VLPWGSLLAAVARPSVPVLRGIRRLCRDAATATIVLAVDAARDRTELSRLGLPEVNAAHFANDGAADYAAAGFGLSDVREVGASDLAKWPSTWARRLAHGGSRTALQLQLRAGE
jgi:hypothetical protein